MTDNPLMTHQPAQAGRVTLESLEAHAAELNRQRFVRAGGAYFVNKRADESGVTHFLDRKISTTEQG